MSARTRKAAAAVLDKALRRQIADLGLKVAEGEAIHLKIVGSLEVELSEANSEIRSLKHMLESADRRAAQDAFDIRRLTRSNAALAEIVGNQAACLTGIDRHRAGESHSMSATEANGEARR